MSDLPTEYDVIIVGSGLAESIVSAALSRIGKAVLHLDCNDYYGDEFSSHSLNGLIKYADEVNRLKEDFQQPPAPLPSSENVQLNYKENLNIFHESKIEYEWHEENLGDDLKQVLLNKSRKFNIDLAPNVFFANGKLIDLLIKSDVSKYCEFKLATRILTQIRSENGKEHLEQIPTSRAEIFKSNKISMIEKRLMMQFVQMCLKKNEEIEAEIGAERNSMAFADFLREKQLSEKVISYIVNSIAMCNRQTRVDEAIAKCKRFLNSVGRYGNTPFLYTIYGNGELSQAFCRLSAVFGGIFHLSLSYKSLVVNKEENFVEAIVTDSVLEKDAERKLKCKHLILNYKYVPKEYVQYEKKSFVSRCVLITNKSIMKDEKETVSCLFLPATERSNDIYLMEVSSTAQTCPDNYYLVYMFCERKNENFKEDFSEAIEFLFSKHEQEDYELPKILFSCFYCHLNSQKSEIKLTNNPSNLYLVKGSGTELDYESNVAQAEELFRKICPNEEFIPRPPEPEHIIFEADNEAIEAETQQKTEESQEEAKPASEEKVEEPQNETKAEPLDSNEARAANE